MIKVIKTGIRIKADPEKVIAKYLYIADENRISRIISDVLLRDDLAVEKAVQGIMEEFENRHHGFKEVLLENYHRIESHISSQEVPSFSQKLLLGSYFTHEYSVESAALFNPSIVIHPDQNGVKEGDPFSPEPESNRRRTYILHRFHVRDYLQDGRN